MKISVRQLDYVVTAARKRSISGAARHRNISTSSILKAIEKFEDEFAVELFVRQRAKGLVLTTAGERAISRTILLLDEVASFTSDLSQEDVAIAGNVSIGCFLSISPNITPQIISSLRSVYPDLIVHLNEGDIMAIQQLLRDGSVDILLTYDAGLSDEFDAEVLIAAPPHVVLAEGDALTKQDSVSLRDLLDRRLLLLNLPQSRNYVLSLFENSGLKPSAIQRLESFEMIRSAAAAGLGVGILNIRPLTDKTYSGLPVVCRPLKENSACPKIVMATRRGSRISRRAESFAAFCRQFFSTEAARQLFVR